MTRKVAFLLGEMAAVGGLEKYARFLMKAFIDKGCQVTLLTTGTPALLPDLKIESFCLNGKRGYRAQLQFDAFCNTWLKNNPHEIVFGLGRNSFQTHYRAGNGVHAAYLDRRRETESRLKTCTFSFNPRHRRLIELEKRAFEHPELKTLFTNSYMVKEEILCHYATSSQKIEVVHNGVEWRDWQTAFDRSLDQHKQGPFLFLFAGNGYRRKGLAYLLHGLERIKNEDFHLHVVGKDRELPTFFRLARKLGLRNKVFFQGPQSSLQPFYQVADALVIPSVYDPFANVTVEALAMGLYVVSSRYNGGKEVINDSTGTIIAELTEPDSVALSLKKALTKPKTSESAKKIRNSIQNLDFSKQLDKIVTKTLKM